MRALIFFLPRSRGTTRWVRTTPWAPPTAAAGMDGSDGRAYKSPVGGKGLSLPFEETQLGEGFVFWRRIFGVCRSPGTGPLGTSAGLHKIITTPHGYCECTIQ